MISRSLKIGVDARVLMRDAYGGVGEYTRRLLFGMANLAPHHEFRLFVNSRSSLAGNIWTNLPPNCKLFHYRFPNKFLNAAQTFLRRPLCDTMVGGADVWWSPHFLPAPLSASCPKVLTIHDLSYLYYPEFFDWKRRVWHRMIQPAREARGADKIIAVSDSTRQDIYAVWNIPSERVEVIYSGVGEEFCPVREKHILARARDRYHLPQRFILFLGVIEPRKNLEGLVRAFEHLRSRAPEEVADLVIAGSYGWSSRSLFEIIKASPFRSRIHVIGFVEEEYKPALYSLAELFVYPSFFEGFGFPPLEAMACGTPTIVSHTSSLPEITQDAAVLIDPLRLEELAFAMEEVLRDQALKVYLREKGFEQARKFSWRDTAARTLAVLETTARV